MCGSNRRKKILYSEEKEHNNHTSTYFIHFIYSRYYHHPQAVFQPVRAIKSQLDTIKPEYIVYIKTTPYKNKYINKNCINVKKNETLLHYKSY